MIGTRYACNTSNNGDQVCLQQRTKKGFQPLTSVPASHVVVLVYDVLFLKWDDLQLLVDSLFV